MKILVIDDDPALTELIKVILLPTEARVILANSVSRDYKSCRK
jgi:DNA-binding response OmpR family regulator